MALAVWIEWGTQPTDFSTKAVQASKCFNSFISYEAVVIAESSEHLDCVEQTLSLRSSLLCLIAECIDIVITMQFKPMYGKELSQQIVCNVADFHEKTFIFCYVHYTNVASAYP